MFNSKKEYIYPKFWNDNDIIKFKYYLKEAKQMYDMPDDLIELCVERQINEDKGLLKPIDYNQVKEIKVETPYYEEFQTTNEELEIRDIPPKERKYDGIIEIEA